LSKMRKHTSSLYRLFFVALLFVANLSFGQTINAGPDDTICPPGCATLTASVTLNANTVPGTGLTLGDDQWSPLIPIGFSFTYFGNTYTNIVVGSNNILTFDASQANGGCPWPISTSIPDPIPTNSCPANSIMCPWEDLLPSANNEVYATIGTAPNRVFVVSYCASPMFGCTNITFTGCVMLYETTNVIETHVANKQLCTSWNSGFAIHGIENAAGTVAYVVPGRNHPAQWTAFNDGYRWTPTGPNTYTGAAIPYAPVILSATTPAINWYDLSTGWQSGSGSTVTVCPNATTQYLAVLSTCSGSVSDTVTVVVTTLTVDAGVDDTVCPGWPSQLNATSPDPITGWSWLPTTGLSNPNIFNPIATPTVTTTYTVTGTNGFCTTSDDVTIVVDNSSLTYTASQTSTSCTSVCDGTATVTVTSSNGPFTYAWSPSGGNGPTATGLCPGTYTCVITAPLGCAGIQTFQITQPPPLAVAITPVPADCDAPNGTATANPTGGTGPYTYLWGSGNTMQTDTGLGIGTYSVLVTDANGCSQTQTVSIVQATPPVALATATPPGFILGGSSQLLATGGTTYQWSPTTDLSCSDCPNPVATPQQTTTYCVIVSDSTINCEDSICITIYVEIPCTSGGLEKLMPNAFSPNADGTNDQFCIPANVCISTFELRIYDRWGEKVFQTTSMTECWDGTYKGEPLNKGLFIYYFDAILTTGDEFHRQGNVSLLK
jgi:gliding motility-associated-like protein